jgi:hypothetical protein
VNFGFSLSWHLPLGGREGYEGDVAGVTAIGGPARRHAQHHHVPTGSASRADGLTEQQHQKADFLYETSKIAFA